MNDLFNVKWGSVFLPHTPLLEIFVRGTITYVALYLLLRLGPKREAGAAGLTDLLVVVLIADAVQNAMAGGYTSITDGLLLVGTILFWSWVLNWAAFRFPLLERILAGSRIPLVRNGLLLRKNMAHELITEDELKSQLRLQGVDDLAEVRVAYIEPDGRVSVITRSPRDQGAPQRRVS